MSSFLNVSENGNVGIGTGTTEPAAKLQVSGGAIMPAAGDSENSGILFPKDPFGGGGDRAWIRYYARSGEATTFEIGTSDNTDDHIALMASGNVGIGTTTPGAKLDVAGTIRATGLDISGSLSLPGSDLTILNLPDARTSPPGSDLETVVVDKATGKLYMQ